MIFITVGTHEQGMDRLFIELDKLINQGIINDNIFAQIGYTKYKPKNFNYKKMIGFQEMDEFIAQSNIIITHGGPGSIFHPLKYGKIPIVVPRNPYFDEHVDEHQILFSKRLENNKKIIGVYDIGDLKDCIKDYRELSEKCNPSSGSSNEFIGKLDFEINKLFS